MLVYVIFWHMYVLHMTMEVNESLGVIWTVRHTTTTRWVTSLFGWVLGWDQTLIWALNFGRSPDRKLARSKPKSEVVFSPAEV